VDISSVIASANISTSAHVLERDVLPTQPDNMVQVQPQNIDALHEFMENSKHYKGLTREELVNLTEQGLIMNPDEGRSDYVTCSVHLRKGKRLVFESLHSLRQHFATGCHATMPEAPRIEPEHPRIPDPAFYSAAEERGGVWEDPDDVVPGSPSSESSSSVSSVPVMSQSPTKTMNRVDLHDSSVRASPVALMSQSPTKIENINRRVDLYDFSVRVQEWCAALTDCFAAVGKQPMGKTNWYISVPKVAALPLQFKEYDEANIGKNKYTLGQLCRSITRTWAGGKPQLETVDVEIGGDYPGQAVETVAVKDIMALLLSGFRNMLKRMLHDKSTNDATDAEQVPAYRVRFVFATIMLMNAQAKMRNSNFRILPQLDKSNQLDSVKVEATCGDLRKYKHVTSSQRTAGELAGRKRRADPYT